MLVQTAPRNRKVQAGVPLDLQVLALDPDENDQVQVAPNYLNVLAGVPQDLAVGLLGPQPGPSDSLEQSERALTMDPETPLPGGPNHSKSNTPRSSVRSSRRQLYNLTPRKLKMKKRLEFVSQTNIAMKERHTNTVKKLQSQINTQKLNRMKYLNQDISRKKTALLKKGEQIHILRKTLAQPQDSSDCSKESEGPGWGSSRSASSGSGSG
jgi:hypothetical protein